MADYIHSTTLDVRDTDCDVQGIVANHVYQEYFAHARHLFINELGYDLKALHEKGMDAVVASITIDYKIPLLPFDKITISTGVEKKGEFQLVFVQQVTRTSDSAIAAEAKVKTATLTKEGPVPTPPEFDVAIEKYLSKR